MKLFGLLDNPLRLDNLSNYEIHFTIFGNNCYNRIPRYLMENCQVLKTL